MEQTAFWPVAVYFALVLVVMAVMIGVPSLLGQRHMDRQTGEPYEAGIEPAGSARMRTDIKFYMVAMFFVIFDLEAAFVFAWAVALREVGWLGYFEMLVFIGVLIAGLIYVWRQGGLNWAPESRRSRDLR